MSSRAEQITSEVRRLVLRCRQLEAELGKSVPKKVLDETVGKMQQKIDSLDSELSNTRSELNNAISMNERIDSIGKQLAEQNEMAKSLSEKFETMIPSVTYEQANARIHELENIVETKNKEFFSLQNEKAKLEQTISHMVTQEQFVSIQTELSNSVPKAKYEEDIQRLRNESMPKEQYNRAESRIAELESQLANSVPRSEFDELSETIVSLTKNAPVMEEEFQTVAPSVATN